MPIIKRRNRHFFRLFGWQVYAFMILLIYPLSRVLFRHAQQESGPISWKIAPPPFLNFLLDVVGEFGALALLFGLCASTLCIGLRMVLNPVAERKEF